ncbi:MAG: D-amino acid aminotransferase [Cellvibrionaceae bacterium]
MSIVYLNGDYLPMKEAKISPMDRGFLFGDGIYEVVPSYNGRLVGFGPHMQRMKNGLAEVEILLHHKEEQWREIAEQLITQNSKSGIENNLGIYFHVSRGADTNRFHAYPQGVEPTVFAFTFEIPPSPTTDKKAAKAYKVSTAQDLRWNRCHIKSTALLGNVMHFQQGHAQGSDETLLFNENNELTEAAACNAYIVKGGVVATPPLDNQILPGITRQILLDILSTDGSIPIEERVISKEEVFTADEVWITSSTKDIAPVITVDDQPVGNGQVGPVWEAAQKLFSLQKFDY